MSTMRCAGSVPRISTPCRGSDRTDPSSPNCGRSCLTVTGSRAATSGERCGSAPRAPGPRGPGLPPWPWAPSVHRLLRHVRDAGLRCVPDVLGTDARGREVLSYLPGTVVDVDA